MPQLCHDIACYLFTFRIPFSTHAAKAPSPSSLIAKFAKSSILGKRSQYHTFSISDYATYEDWQDALLRSQKRRAALFWCGIIWHLVMEFSISLIEILLRLSDATEENGNVFVDTDCTCWNNNLTPKKLDLICRVYHMYTGKDSGIDSSNKCTDWQIKAAESNAPSLHGGQVKWSGKLEELMSAIGPPHVRNGSSCNLMHSAPLHDWLQMLLLGKNCWECTHRPPGPQEQKFLKVVYSHKL